MENWEDLDQMQSSVQLQLWSVDVWRQGGEESQLNSQTECEHLQRGVNTERVQTVTWHRAGLRPEERLTGWRWNFTVFLLWRFSFKTMKCCVELDSCWTVSWFLTDGAWIQSCSIRTKSWSCWNKLNVNIVTVTWRCGDFWCSAQLLVQNYCVVKQTLPLKTFGGPQTQRHLSWILPAHQSSSCFFVRSSP